MTLPDRASNAEKWDFDKLVTILLRQFKRLLAERGVKLTDAETQQIGESVAQRAVAQRIDAGEQIPAIRAAMVEIVAESVQVLGQWNLTFAQSLATPMTEMPGWETTADFLELANEKVNAEVRVSAGSSLLVALGDVRYAHFLVEAIEHDLEALGQLDVDAIIGRRALLFASGIDGDAPDWVEQVRAWVESAAKD
ncbi:MAG: hypothetical protein SF029_04825 [bacterium]|nr:hypothetical protein [bacterium]